MQALAEEPPILPVQLLRRQVYQTLIEHDEKGNPIDMPSSGKVEQTEPLIPAKLRTDSLNTLGMSYV